MNQETTYQYSTFAANGSKKTGNGGGLRLEGNGQAALTSEMRSPDRKRGRIDYTSKHTRAKPNTSGSTETDRVIFSTRETDTLEGVPSSKGGNKLSASRKVDRRCSTVYKKVQDA